MWAAAGCSRRGLPGGPETDQELLPGVQAQDQGAHVGDREPLPGESPHVAPASGGRAGAVPGARRRHATPRVMLHRHAIHDRLSLSITPSNFLPLIRHTAGLGLQSSREVLGDAGRAGDVEADVEARGGGAA
jgi:hypothetical protein